MHLVAMPTWGRGRHQVGQINAGPGSGIHAHKPPGHLPRAGRLLVVDDDRLVAAALERSLAVEHECRSASGARAALALIGSGARFDVILCDLMMPDMSGMDLHSALMTSHPDQADRIIFLTGGAFTQAARDFLDRVPNLWLEKPVDLPQLRMLVNQRIG